jgi:hypothetical protein
MTGCPRKARSLHRRTATRRHSRRLCEAAGTVPTPFLDSRKSVTGAIKLKCAIAHAQALERLPMAALVKLRRQRNNSCALVLHLQPCPVMKAAPGTQNGSIELKNAQTLGQGPQQTSGPIYRLSACPGVAGTPLSALGHGQVRRGGRRGPTAAHAARLLVLTLQVKPEATGSTRIPISVRSRKLTMLIKRPKFPQTRHTQATIRLATGIWRPIIYRSRLPVEYGLG